MFIDRAYETQLDAKKRKIVGMFGMAPTVHHSEPWHYRNRMDFTFHSSGAGLKEKNNWKSIVDIETCAISDERINKLLGEVRSSFSRVDSFDTQRRSGTFYYLVLRTASEASVSFVLNPDSRRIAEAQESIRAFAEKTSAENVLVTYSNSDSVSSDYFCVKGQDTLTTELCGKQFQYSSQGFFQNNYRIAELMHTYCTAILEQHKGGMLLDLFGGVGTFGIINSHLFEDVITVESFKGCTEAALKNILMNNCSNVQAITLDCGKISRLETKRPLKILADPPRSGMGNDALRHIKDMAPELLLYVSCNPEQLEKDVRKLGYTLKSLALFDMFPHTPHMEVVAELVP